MTSVCISKQLKTHHWYTLSADIWKTASDFDWKVFVDIIANTKNFKKNNITVQLKFFLLAFLQGSSCPEYSVKKVLLKISQNSRENICAAVSF